MELSVLYQQLRQHFSLPDTVIHLQDEAVVWELEADELSSVCQQLRDHETFQFDQLMDVCGVDYSTYGQSEWIGDAASSKGFCRGSRTQAGEHELETPRFAVAYQLMSTVFNRRLRLRVFADADQPQVPSLTGVWASANWFEREAFDLFGIVFEGHPDLRRILTDYGFIGYPFRKDFPLSGHVQARYDADKKRVVYEPVDIEPRVLVPRVIRHDHRYIPHPDND